MLITNDKIYELPLLFFAKAAFSDNSIALKELSSLKSTLLKLQQIKIFEDYLTTFFNSYSSTLEQDSFIKYYKNNESEIDQLIQNLMPHIKKLPFQECTAIKYLLYLITKNTVEATKSVFSFSNVNLDEKVVLHEIANELEIDYAYFQTKNFWKTIGDSQKNNFQISNTNTGIYISITQFSDAIILNIDESYFEKITINNVNITDQYFHILGPHDWISIVDFKLTYEDLSLYFQIPDNEMFIIEEWSKNFSIKATKENGNFYLELQGSVVNETLKLDNQWIEPYHKYLVTPSSQLIYNSTLYNLYKYLKPNDNDSQRFSFAQQAIYLQINSNTKNYNVTYKENNLSHIKISSVNNKCEIEILEDSLKIFSIQEIIQNKIIFDCSSTLFLNDLWELDIDILNKSIKIATNYSYNIDVKNIFVAFSHATILNNINFSVDAGEKVCIMGPSGCGKSTLLDLLSNPSTFKNANVSGTITYNHKNIFEYEKELQNDIGFVTQDDILFSDLTVFENLFYSSRVRYPLLPKEILINRINKVLLKIGLLHKQDDKVGSTISKVLSGGQRKRLNIALELMGNPKILFLDEPTSGLSSMDSLHIIELINELANEGITIFTVLHQPSSEIFFSFDKLLFLTDGQMAFYGSPKESVEYFSSQFAQDSQLQCNHCNNFNTNSLFELTEEAYHDTNGNVVYEIKDGVKRKKLKYDGIALSKKFFDYKEKNT